MAALTVAVQMDPIEAIDIDADTTFELMMSAQDRGHALLVYEPDGLSWRDGEVVARVQKVEALRRERGAHVSLGPPHTIALETVDAVLVRQDPPFDMAYLTTTWILERLPKRVLVVNDPRGVRDAPEKLFAMRTSNLTPPTLVTRDKSEAEAFRKLHGEIVVKPLYLSGGAGIFRIRPDDDNFNAAVETLAAMRREPFVVQKYLPAVRDGDKRVLVIDGEPVGAINRVPAAGDARSNLHVGGRAEPAELDDRDRAIVAAVAPELRAMGLLFAGLDVIGGYLTEVNVTSPTGLQELKRFSLIDAAAAFWSAVETRIASTRRPD